MKTDKSEIDLWPSGLPANARFLPDEQIEQLKKTTNRRAPHLGRETNVNPLSRIT